MDSKTTLILVYEKNEWLDKTENISRIKHSSPYYKVFYEGNNQPYTYKEGNLRYLTSPQSLPVKEKSILVDSELKQMVTRADRFKDIVKLYFENSNTEIVSYKKLEIHDDCNSDQSFKEALDYLKEASKYQDFAQKKNSDNQEEPTEQNFLSKQYENITDIHPNSFLIKFLQDSRVSHHEWQNEIIFPFGLNRSQFDAVNNALSYNASIIEGPPGTGKTQTILNIISNLVVQGKSIAVVSNNNSATKNVQEKLEEYGFGFMTAFLGNKDNVKKFLESCNEIEYPDFSEWVLPEAQLQKDHSLLTSMCDKLVKAFEQKNRLAVLKDKKSSTQTEQKYFEDFLKQSQNDFILKLNLKKLLSEKLIKLIAEINILNKQNKLTTFSTRFKMLFKYGIWRFNRISYNPIGASNAIKQLYYTKVLDEIEKEILEIDKSLIGFQQLIKNYSELSKRYFKARISKLYSKAIVKQKVDYKYRYNFKEFLKKFPVILSTTHSLRSCSSNDFMFDYLVVDEASQVDIVTGSLAFTVAKNVVVVGDLKQLPHIIEKDCHNFLEETRRKYNTKDRLNIIENSLLSAMNLSMGIQAPKTLLKEHYRCHPQIIRYCNQKFYNNQLIIHTEGNFDDKVFKVIQTQPGNHQRSTYNQREIDVVYEEVLKTGDINQSDTVGIASPYRKQVNIITEGIKSMISVEADTVHKYQGRQRDIMILTTVVNNLNDFVDDPNLVNVAVSRAVKKLIIVTSKNTINQQGSNIGDLIRYVNYNSLVGEVVDSKIISVFDLLYSEYSDELKKILSRLKKVSKFNSENIMNYEIEQVLAKNKYRGFKHVLHVPLKSIVKVLPEFTENEVKFLNNPWSHVDFLIFNSLGKNVVLIVEVDGISTHEESSIQQERDLKKDSILKKANIPFVRIKTNVSDIKNLFESALENALHNH